MIRLELLGGFRVTIGEMVIPDDMWKRRKQASLVKALCLAPQHRMRRDQLADLLWPELSSAAGAANLRKAIHLVRQMYPGRYKADPIVSTGDMLSLPVEHIWVDVVAFRSHVTQGRELQDLDAYATGVRIYRHGLLPDDADEWVDPHRRDLQSDYLTALAQYAAILESAGLLEQAAQVAQRLISTDPLVEDAHVRLIRVLALAGRRPEALRQFERLAAVLDTELGVEPGPAAQRVFEEVRAGEVPEPAHTAPMWQRIGDLRTKAGDDRGAVSAYESGLVVAWEPAELARLHRRAAAAHLVRHDVDRAEPHLRRAETLGRDRTERARVICLRAELAWRQGDLDTARDLATTAREQAADAGTPEDIDHAEEVMAHIAHLRGDWRAGLEIELRRSGAVSLTGASDVHQGIGQFHLYSDELSLDAEQYARRVLRRATDAGNVRVQAFAWCLLGESLLLRGYFDEAATCLEHSAELHAAVGSDSGAAPWQRLAELAASQGRLHEVGSALRRASVIATVSPMARHFWGRIHATAAFAWLQQGEPARAAQSIQAASVSVTRYGDCRACGALLHPVAAETYAVLGSPDEALAHASAARATADAFGGSAWSAMAESAAGSAALAAGDASGAGAHFLAAAGHYDAIEHHFWAGRSRRQALLVPVG